MIREETDDPPAVLDFDVVIVAVGYERRCRWVTNAHDVSAKRGLGLEFGFLAEGSYADNRTFFERRSYQIVSGVSETTPNVIAHAVELATDDEFARVLVDISSMSREMIANVAIGLERARKLRGITLTIAYAPSKFTGPYRPAPIRRASPIKPSLAGWSSQPEQPLGAIFGLGCEPGLALGALQFLEPNNAWIFRPKGIDPDFDAAMMKANEHIGDIFDITDFGYEINKPTITRGRLEALLNAVENNFRVVIVPFGPKIFAWLAISTIVFSNRHTVGVWTFSSKEQAVPVDRDADNQVIWHNFKLTKYITDTKSRF
jgi:hypothetical protein